MVICFSTLFNWEKFLFASSKVSPETIPFSNPFARITFDSRPGLVRQGGVWPGMAR